MSADAQGGGGDLGVGLGEEVGVRDAPVSESETLQVTIDEGDTRRPGDMGELVEAWEDYLVAKEGQVLCMEDMINGDVLVVPHSHRWDSQYRRKTYAKLKAAEEHVQRVWGETCPTTLLTLTAPHNDERGGHRGMVDVLEELKEAWDKARRVIGRATEGVKTEFLAVWEPHASGYPHLHVIVFGVARPSLGEKVTEYWTDRYVEGASKDAQSVDIRRGRSLQLENPAAYLMKYLSKSLGRETSGEEQTVVDSLPSIAGYKEFSALMWATGKRTYSMSGGLSAAVKEAAPDDDDDSWDSDKERDWEYVAAVSGIQPGFYEGSDARKLSKWLGGSPNQREPPDAAAVRSGGTRPTSVIDPPDPGEVRGGEHLPDLMSR